MSDRTFLAPKSLALVFAGIILAAISVTAVLWFSQSDSDGAALAAEDTVSKGNEAMSASDSNQEESALDGDLDVSTNGNRTVQRRKTGEQGPSLYSKMLEADSLPAERRLVNSGGSLRTMEIFEMMLGPDFQDVISDLHEQAFDDELALELTNTYQSYLTDHISQIDRDGFELGDVACGLRVCVGQVYQAEGAGLGSPGLGRLPLSDSGPDIYAMVERRVELSDVPYGTSPYVSRFLFSIDPANRSAEVSLHKPDPSMFAPIIGPGPD